MKNEMRDRLKLLVSGYIAPLLKEEGFRKYRMVWNRKNQDNITVFSIQVSQWDNASFTFNLGMFVSEIRSMLWDRPLPKIAREVECFPRFRIGDLIKDQGGKDIWYTLEDAENMSAYGPYIQNIIRTHCIPFLRKCKYPDEIFRMYDIPELWIHPAERISYAISQYLLGNTDRCMKILDEMVNRKKPSTWKEVIEKVRNRLIQKRNPPQG